MIHTYGAKAVDEQAGSAMRNLKPFFDEIGRLHRKYSTQVEEQVTGPLLAWTKVINNYLGCFELFFLNIRGNFYIVDRNNSGFLCQIFSYFVDH